MNVYKYIRSKDVREYNERIGHKFTAIESAFLVWKNYDLTIQEKHDAWREIMSEMPDEEVKRGCQEEYAPSLFTLLEGFIKEDNVLIEEFYKQDEQSVYSYGYYSDNGSFFDDFGRIYSNFDYMQRSVRQDRDDITYVKYTKKYLSSPFKILCSLRIKMKRL